MWRWETKDPPPSEPHKGYGGLAGGPFTARGMVQALIKSIDTAAPDDLRLPATSDGRKRSGTTVRCANERRRASCAIDATVAGAVLR
jgi:hypothetical protein